MQPKDIIFKELVKRGHSKKNGTRVWDISDSKLWYLTPELSKGFLNIKKYHPYRKAVVDRELVLIKKHAQNIISNSSFKSFNLIDLGCGNGLKAEEFIKQIENGYKLRYCPVDISKYFLDSSVNTVKSMKSKNVVEIKESLSDFSNLDEILGILRSNDFRKNLSLLLGETISHYEINDFLYLLSNSMFKGDVIIIGNGMRIGERFANLEKYQDPLFNDWFIHVVKNLGLDEEEVEYDARFANGRLEAFYRLKVDKTIEHEGQKIDFKKGDEIVVGIQYKYFEDELKKFFKMYFSKVDVYKTDDNEYGLFVCKK